MPEETLAAPETDHSSAPPVGRIALTAPTPRAEWTAAQRVGFRFLFSYLVLYLFANPMVPGLNLLALPFRLVLSRVAPWVGVHLLHLRGPIASAPTGSGDTTYDWLVLLCLAVFAVAISVVWSLRARAREYRRLAAGLRVALRYSLALVMLLYGAGKVIQMQFPPPSLQRLVEPFGSLSPMGLLWSFMGYSYPYNLFAGLGEMVGGTLLFWRRTTTLGALLLIAVLSNVVILNFSYDVPVKLFSSHLLLIALVLVAPEARRLVNVLVLGRAAGPSAWTAPYTGRGHEGWRAVKPCLVGLAAVGLLGFALVQSSWVSRRPVSPTRGIWDVARLERDHRPVALLVTDSSLWRRLIVEDGGWGAVQRMDGSFLRFAPPGKDHRLRGGGRPGFDLGYSRPDSAHLELVGTLEGDPVNIQLRRVDADAFLLRSRGFHWVSEVPFNR
jgi:uncharacterized membrane protein YphA (DoxX/SURF4 family)